MKTEKKMKTSSKRILTVSMLFIVGPLVLFLVCGVIAEIYQVTRGNSSLSEVSRNVNLPEGADNSGPKFTPIASLSFEEVQSKYREYDDDQWREYALSILGNRVSWSGKVSSIERRRVEVDMGSAPLQYTVLLGLTDNEKDRLTIGDLIEFEGRLITFHQVKGMCPGLDNVQIK